MNDTETQYCLYCPECSRWHDTRSGCEADIRLDERQKIQAEMAAQVSAGDKARAREAILESALTSLLASLATQPTFPGSPLTLAMDRARKVLRGEQEGQEKRPAIVQAAQTPLSALLTSGEYRRFDVQIEPDGTAVYTEAKIEGGAEGGAK